MEHRPRACHRYQSADRLDHSALSRLAAAFRLNLAASQLANHLMYPFQILLLVPFLRVGAQVFHTGPIPLSPQILFSEGRHHPIELIESLWLWESHALILWAVASVVLLPGIALLLGPALRRVLARVERHQYPLIPTL